MENKSIPGIKPCVGCGYCCWESTCSLGFKFYGTTHPCPALYWNGQQYRCKLADDFANHLYISEGCSSSLNTWRRNVQQRTEISQ